MVTVLHDISQEVIVEGPSIVIAENELAEFKNQKIVNAQGTARFNWDDFKDKKYLGSTSWGKHLILQFSHLNLRIHFLMFGSYRIDNPRENRIPKMQLSFKNHEVYFYSCAIKEITKAEIKDYDQTINVMSDEWDRLKAAATLASKPDVMVCDILMDQEIFAGVGNIIKNEILYKLKIHPETKLQSLSKPQVKKLSIEAREYSLQFFNWKNMNVLKKNWKIFRKKKCPDCGKAVTKKSTGKLKRISHYCGHCQKK